MMAITPHDTNTINKQYNHALYVEVAGNVKVTFLDDSTYTFLAVGAGQTINAEVKIVWSTGTTATGIYGVKEYR